MATSAKPSINELKTSKQTSLKPSPHNNPDYLALGTTRDYLTVQMAQDDTWQNYPSRP